MKTILMNNFRLIRNTAVILILSGLTLLLLNSSGASAKDVLEKKAVATKAGLNLRDKPDTSGQKKGLIPFGEEVEITGTQQAEVTIAGKTGHWVKVRWKNLEGWAFDAFLGETGSSSPLLDHFISISVQITGDGDTVGAIHKKAGQDKMYGGASGNNEGSTEVSEKKAWISGDSVAFEYIETEYTTYDDDSTKATYKYYECYIEGKKILATNKGDKLETAVKCKKIRTEKE